MTATINLTRPLIRLLLYLPKTYGEIDLFKKIGVEYFEIKEFIKNT